MNNLKKFQLSILAIFIVFSLILLIIGYFKIGLLSDDYLNFYDATHSTFQQKVTGSLPFTNTLHIRPVYYLSLEKSYVIHNWLGLEYDNFAFYRIQSLVLILLISYLTGRILLELTGRFSLALVSSLSVLIYPNNLNNICWTAARVDLLCCLFFVTVIFFLLRYSEKKDILSLVVIITSFTLALFTKESSLTLPAVVVMMIYFIYGKEYLLRLKVPLIIIFLLLAVYLLFRFVFIGNSLTEIATLYQSNPLANAPGVITRAAIGLTIPLDFLTLNRMLKLDYKIVLLYLASLYGAVFYLIWIMIKVDIYKHIGQIASLVLVIIIPYIFVGYIRPQMILMPFVIVMIFTLWVYNHHRQFNVSINKLVLKIFYTVALVFWLFWSYQVITDWEFSYANAKENVNGLISTGLDNSKRNVLIGSMGRYKQTFLFDKMTGAYNFWKEKSFTIKDTINDVIQTGTLDNNSIKADLEIKNLGTNEFEIKAIGKSQFFYIEGYNPDKIRTGFRNDDISVEFTEFNYLDKPIKLKLTILSEKVSCYLATESKFIKIF